jgi:hypothetical protein
MYFYCQPIYISFSLLVRDGGLGMRGFYQKSFKINTYVTKFSIVFCLQQLAKMWMHGHVVLVA